MKGALETGKRSQEVEDEWRLFKISNIKSMWFTGRFFNMKPQKYNASDKGMINVEVAADFSKIKKFQKELIEKSKENKKPSIVPLFKTQETKKWP